MKKIVLTIFVLFLIPKIYSQTPPPGFSAPILFDSFNYPPGQLTDRGNGANVSGGNWVDTSGSGNYIQVINGGLNYPGYPQVMGNKIKITSTTASAEDVWRNFVPESLKTVCISFLMQLIDTTLLTSNTATSNAEYFLGVLASTQTTNYGARVYARKGTGNNFQIGIRATTNSSSTTPISWSNENLSVGNSHLIFMTYKFIDPKVIGAGVGNDSLKLWLDPNLDFLNNYPDPSWYPDPDHIPFLPNAISVATGGYEQPNIGRIFIRQGYNSANGSTPNAFITNILVDTTLNAFSHYNDDKILNFNISNLVFENPNGPAMLPTAAHAYLSYRWNDAYNTTTTCNFENLQNVTSTNSIKFKIFRGELSSFKLLTIPTPNGPNLINGDERIYGIDSGYISDSNVPKLYFNQIVWHQVSIYQLNHSSLAGFASIDTLRSDPVWLDAIGRENKSLTFRASSSSFVIQGNIGLFTGEISVYANKGTGKFSRAVKSDSTVFEQNVSTNSRNVQMSAIFTPAPTYFSQPNSDNYLWGNSFIAGFIFGDLSMDDELRENLLKDTINIFIYPVNYIFGGTPSAYRTKLKLNVEKIMTLFDDTLENFRVYEEAIFDSIPRLISKNRIKFIQPSTILIDSVEQNGVMFYYLTKKRKSGGMYVGDEKNTPTNFALMQNYPNPFNPTTKLKFSIPEKSQVKLEVFNTLGQKTLTIVDEILHPGLYEKSISLNAKSGIYFYKITAMSVLSGKVFTETKKMLLVK